MKEVEIKMIIFKDETETGVHILIPNECLAPVQKSMCI